MNYLEAVAHYVASSGTSSAAQAGLGIVILLPQPPELWDVRCVPPQLTWVCVKAEAVIMPPCATLQLTLLTRLSHHHLR